MDYRLLINGQLVAGGRQGNVINPATEEIIANYPVASEQQLHEAIGAAKAAFPAWSALPITERRKVLYAIADRIAEHAAELARIDASESGKILSFAEFEVGHHTVGLFRALADFDLPTTIVEDSETRRIEIQRRPLGVVAAIIPWNFPASSCAVKLAPALIAGNTTILKPAPTTPLSALKIGELIADLVPPGVVNIIADANDLGDAITGHPDIDKITFTGSTKTGKRVYAQAAETVKRVTLELGGNDAAIVLDDADPVEIAPAIFTSAFVNNAEACVATKRLYVHETLYDAMCNELARLADEMIVGDPFDPNVQLGPLQNAMQYEKAKQYLADAREHGHIIAGGEIPEGPGYFIRPTIVRDIAEGSRLVDEEQFSPILPVIKYSDLDDVIRRANDTVYGLAASVWSSNTDRAAAVAARIEAGIVWINHHLDVAPGMPYGGAKQSGIGMELGGVEGLLEFTQFRVVNMAK